MKIHMCPDCGSSNVRRNGRDKRGKQRYICKTAGCLRTTFIEEYTYKACDPEVINRIVYDVVIGNSVRATARVFGVSKDTVAKISKAVRIVE